MIITISRETGSGGHAVGQLLAERLGYTFYDKEIVAAVAKEMHLDETSGKEKIPFDEIRTVQDRLQMIKEGKKNA